MEDIEKLIVDIAVRAKRASQTIVSLSTDNKNKVLLKMAELIELRRDFIKQENAKDLEIGRSKKLSESMLDRLELSDSVIDAMISGIEQVAALPDPVGGIASITSRPNGLKVGRMCIPLGVICMIYESRPNVTVDAAALCLKAGNAVILRGGSEAIFSNMALANVLQEALTDCSIEQDTVQVIPVKDRKAVDELIRQEGRIDLVIPRGGEGLIRFVSENSRIPVLKHYKGVCHIFVDKSADLTKATPIILNAKVQRPGVCNALEGLLIHRDIADQYLPVIAGELKKQGVRLLGCKNSVAIDSKIEEAGDADWGTEFLDLVLCVKVVKGFDEAKEYIRRYGSQHTECILTEDYSLANTFVREIDASAVMVNASTRFNDGSQLGLGAEIGISTTKLHAYGPMGLEELTAKKFVVYGEGQVRM